MCQLSIAASNMTPMTEDLKDAARSYSQSSAELMPDLKDPYLMMKLSRALAQSLGMQHGT
ncbi:hypothetical protein RC74_06270 [Falsihalocynthiibacter arcticus]|uniref:Uncharacterized protein n=1 Tax=Falsihalocynthiibacter arcticus TaxID=1579316 RepID=A0A126UXY3_9RHOB|nr:hypothetical protein RC74_06270 [Falsihalocynthiibacter arcticus]